MTIPPVPDDDYLRTDFIAFDGDREVSIRIGEHSAEFDALLLRHAVSGGLFITGWNPYSQPATPDENGAANARMSSLFARRGVTALPHAGKSSDGAWIEEGFFALGLSAEEGLLIASEFDQDAIVMVRIGHPADLHLTGKSIR